MSEVQRTGANHAATNVKPASNTANGAKKASNTKQNVPVGANNTKQTELLQEPKHPEQKIEVYTIRQNDIVSYVAERYNIGLSEVKKANPGVDLENVRPGQQIKIPYYDPKEMEVYNKKYEAYSKQQREIQHAKDVKQRTETAKKNIEQAKKNGWEPYYSFSINSEGYIVVKPLDGQKLHEIRSDLGLPSGHLDSMNDLESKYGKIPKVDNGTRYVETWDNIKTRENDTFIIEPSCLRTSRTWGQAFKDFFSF